MNLYDIINEASEITLNIKAKDLRDYSRSLLAGARAELAEARATSGPEDRLLTEAETLAYLNTSASTLARTVKRGTLTPVYWAGEKRYRMSDIQKCLKTKK